MSRSLKKGPFVHPKLLKKVLRAKDTGNHKLGEFAPTRTYKGHTGHRKAEAKPGAPAA
jgi:ribosomal protein S19